MTKNPINVYKEFQYVKNQRIKLTSTSPFTPGYVQANLAQSADPASLYASRIQSNHLPLENPARESAARKVRLEKRKRQDEERKRKQLGVIGTREARIKGVWRLEQEQTKFSLFLPLHHLWLGYMSELLGLSYPPSSPSSVHSMPSAAGMHIKLVKADFHGSIVTVKESKNPFLIGLSGIAIHETENTFKVITVKDELKVLPKENSVFLLAIPLYSTPPGTGSSAEHRWTVLDQVHMEFDLYGNQFQFRSADRAGRKFKHKETVEL